MLILTRRINEKILIGNDIEVSVLGVHGSQVRIGIDAPKEIEVHREEIYNRIHSNEENGNVLSRHERVKRINGEPIDKEAHRMATPQQYPLPNGIRWQAARS